MPTREEVFEELGLMPVYVRKGYVPASEKQALPAAQISQVASEFSAPTSSESVADISQRSVEIEARDVTPIAAKTPSISAIPAAQISPLSPQFSEPISSETASAMPSKKQIKNDERAERIAALDWDALEADIAQCTACGLCKTRNKTVPGAGARNANWMIVGEAPGADEDEQGMPFVGRSGKLLDAMLRATNHSREKNVFIANTLKCRPPDNRNPALDELEACAPYLHRQIVLMKPKMLLTVGKFAAQTITGSEDAIGAMRGRTFDYQTIPVRVTYHPSYLLRAPLEKAKAWDDLLAAMKLFPAS
jgi:uracil-DNA glycosylase